jgi:LuxR family maltose regulon positive regulatory protein
MLANAATLLLAGRAREASTRVGTVLDTTEPGAARNNPDVAARALYTDAVVKLARGDVMSAARTGRESRVLLDAALPGEWERLRGPLLRMKLCSLLGLYERGRTAHDEFLASRHPRLPSDDVMGDATLAELEFNDGRLALADRLATRAIDGAERAALPVPADALYVAGAVRVERNEEDAIALLESAVGAADTRAMLHPRVLSRIALARAVHPRDGRDRAHEVLDDARRHVGDDDVPAFTSRIDDADAMLALVDGDVAAAELYVERLPEPLRTRRQARLAAAGGHAAEAAATVATVRSATVRDRIDALLVTAWAARGVERRRDLLAEALRLGEPDRYVRTFAEQGPWVREPLVQLIADWPTPYVADVVDALATRPNRASATVGELTQREQQVLRYLATSLSMREIARTLYVSPNTLKCHTRSIYRKLGVSGRHAASRLAYPHHEEAGEP